MQVPFKEYIYEWIDEYYYCVGSIIMCFYFCVWTNILRAVNNIIIQLYIDTLNSNAQFIIQ